MPKPDIDPQIVRAMLNRLFPAQRAIPFERMRSGGSTQVYRIDRDAGAYYLRFGEEPEDTFAPEAWVHDQLERLGVRAPRVVLFEDVAQEIDRSIMITTEIPGQALELAGMGIGEGLSGDLSVYLEAGRDLALVNSVEVGGFGFVCRSRPWNGELTGSQSSFVSWLQSTIGNVSALDSHFTDQELVWISDRVLAVIAMSESECGALAHGDFDTSHIFAHDGEYAGLIDFGEIRGADRWYDLADFLLHASGKQPAITAVIQGYSSICPLQHAEIELIEARAVVLGVAWLQRIRGRNLAGYESALAASIRQLLTQGSLRDFT